MLDNDNIWKDKFNETSLNDEEWLEPSPDVLANVMEAVDQPKRRRLAWLMWGLLILSLLVSLVLLTMDSAQLGSNSESLLATDSGVNQSIDISTNVTPDNNIFPEGSITLGEELVDPSTDDLDLTEENNNRVRASEVVRIPKIQTNSTEKTAPLNDYINSDSALKSEQFAAIENFEIESKFTAINPAEENITNTYSEAIPNTKLENITAIDNRSFGLEYNSQKINISIPLAEIQEKSDVDKRFALGAETFYSIWDFNLNSSYTAALDPADFYHNTGKSYGAALNFQQNITNRLSWFAELSYESAEFNSGHNSALEYDPNQEQGMRIDYDLTMASPIGFINSDIVISRSTNNTAATDIVVDLHNKHEIQNLDLGLGMSYQWLQKGNLSLNTAFGLGVNRFISNSNMLEYCGTDSNDYHYDSGHVTSSQTKLIDTNYYTMAGVNARYAFAGDWYVGMNMMFKYNLSVIYREDDFSTQLNRIRAGLQIGKNF